MSGFLLWLLRTTTTGSVVICLLLLVRRLFCKRIPATWRYAMWLLVLVCLLNPWRLPSPMSVLGIASPAMEHLAPRPSAASSLPLHDPPIPVVQDTDPEPPLHTTPIDLSVLVFAIWSAGALMVLSRFLVQNIRFARRLRSSMLDPAVQKACDDISYHMRIRRRVWCYITDAVRSPCIVSPQLRLYVTEDVASKTEDLRFVLLHEMNHIRQHDIATAWLRNAVLIVHWFNPLAWLASRTVHRDAELSCDARVLSTLTDEEARQYGHMLLRAARGAGHKERLLMIGWNARPRLIQERIGMLVSPPAKRQVVAYGLCLLALFLGGVCLTNAIDPSSETVEPPDAAQALFATIPATTSIPTRTFMPSASPSLASTPIPEPPPRFSSADMADMTASGLRFPIRWDDPDATRLDDALARFGVPKERAEGSDESLPFGPGKGYVSLVYDGFYLGFQELRDGDFVLTTVSTLSDDRHLIATDDELARIAFPRGLDRRMNHEEAEALFWGAGETPLDTSEDGHTGTLTHLLYHEVDSFGNLYEGIQRTYSVHPQSDTYCFVQRFHPDDGVVDAMVLILCFSYYRDDLYRVEAVMDITPIGRQDIDWNRFLRIDMGV